MSDPDDFATKLEFATRRAWDAQVRARLAANAAVKLSDRRDAVEAEWHRVDMIGRMEWSAANEGRLRAEWEAENPGWTASHRGPAGVRRKRGTGADKR